MTSDSRCECVWGEGVYVRTSGSQDYVLNVLLLKLTNLVANIKIERLNIIYEL